MSRVDKPTLKCDRCGQETQSIFEMGKFRKLSHYQMSGSSDWDLCPECWSKFITFIGESDVQDDTGTITKARDKQ